jgi:hypothetical protein
MSGGCFGSGTTTPEPDSTPVGGVVKPCDKRNFVIILGAPGKYDSEDPHHDQYWGNYFVAAQHVFGVPESSDFVPETSLLEGECVHWLVYGQPYIDRWVSDMASQFDFQRKHASGYPAGYLSRIQQYVGQLNKKHPGRHKYVPIDSYKDVWETLHRLPNGTLTRMHYFGHGAPTAFFMRYATKLPPTPDELIEHAKIDQYKSWLAAKARPSDDQKSKFYACKSITWAKKWSSATGLKSEGAVNTIVFRGIREDSDLRGLENDDNPQWGPAN